MSGDDGRRGGASGSLVASSGARSSGSRPFVVRACYPDGATMTARRFKDRTTSHRVAEVLRRAGCTARVVYAPDDGVL